MTGNVSARTAQLGLIALEDVLVRAAPRRNGRPVPDDVKTALDELRTASASPTRTELGPGVVPVQRFERIDVATAAARLGISTRAVQKRCAAGSLPAVRVGQRTWSIEWKEGTDG